MRYETLSRRKKAQFRRSMSKADHLREAERLAKLALRKSEVHYRYLSLAERKYGKQGAYISGGFYDSWPERAKESVRKIRHHDQFADAAYGHYLASGRRSSSWHAFLKRQQKNTCTRRRR